MTCPSGQAAEPGPVAAAVLADDSAALRAALAAGGSADAPDSAIDRRPVHLIAAPGGTRNPDMLEVLARSGADLNVIDPYTGLTPLAAAMIVPDGDSAQGIIELARSLSLTRQLLRLGADPDRALARGETPLMIAVALDNLPAAKLLIEHGARTDARDSSGATALHRAQILQRSPEMIAALIGAGASPAARDAEGNTPQQAAELAVAARSGITARRITIDGAPAAAPVDEDAARLEDGADRAPESGGSNLRKWLIGGAAVAAAVAGTVVLAALVQNQKKRRNQGAQAPSPAAPAAPVAVVPPPAPASAPAAAPQQSATPPVTATAPASTQPQSPSPASPISTAPVVTAPVVAAPAAPAKPATPAVSDPTRVTIQPYNPAPSLQTAIANAAAATTASTTASTTSGTNASTASIAAPVAAAPAPVVAPPPPAATTPTAVVKPAPVTVVAAVVATPAPAPVPAPVIAPATTPASSAAPSPAQSAPVSTPVVAPVASTPVKPAPATSAPAASAPVTSTPVTPTPVTAAPVAGLVQAISALMPATTTTKPPASSTAAPATTVTPAPATPAPALQPAAASALVVAPATGAGNSNDREIAIDRIDVLPAAPHAGQDLRIDVTLRNRSGYQLDRALWRLIDMATGRVLWEQSFRMASRETMMRSASVPGRTAGKTSLAVMAIPGQPTAPTPPAPTAGSRPGTVVQVNYVFNPGNEVVARREFSIAVATPPAPPPVIATPAPVPAPSTPVTPPAPTCAAPLAAIDGKCERDARNFKPVRQFPGCSVSGNIARDIPAGPCADLEYHVERFNAGCLTRSDGNISMRIRSWHQCLADNSTGGFRDRYLKELADYDTANLNCHPGFAVNGQCVQFPICGMGSIGGYVCSCSGGRVVGTNGLCVIPPRCTPPQVLQNNVCITPPPRPAPSPAPAPGSGGGSGGSGGGSSGGGSSGGGPGGGGSTGGGGSSGGGTTSPGIAGIQALMFCWQNKNNHWFCDGRVQFTDIGEKGDEGLRENMGLAGCKSPALVGPITLESTSPRVTGTRSGILFRCSDRLAGEPNTRDQGHLTWNRNIRLFWRDLSGY